MLSVLNFKDNQMHTDDLIQFFEGEAHIDSLIERKQRRNRLKPFVKSLSVKGEIVAGINGINDDSDRMMRTQFLGENISPIHRNTFLSETNPVGTTKKIRIGDREFGMMTGKNNINALSHDATGFNNSDYDRSKILGHGGLDGVYQSQ